MAFHKEKKYSEKHQQKDIVNPEIKNHILQRSKDGKMSCTVAFEIAGEQNISPDKIGITIDLLNIKMTKCQLGLFGYKPKKKMLKLSSLADPDIEDAISEALVEGRLSCKHAWNISSRLNANKITVSSTCEFLGIKINDCQLGAF
ncbi:MAG: hypothetical protein JRJ41_07005 [Deltaproteobacteria bacterium]|jgi:hypothetical protein|nr:hypothetical protein [Deltaproteobacteria bacterium]